MKKSFKLCLVVGILVIVALSFMTEAKDTLTPLTQTEKQLICGAACKDCVAEWVSQADLLGGNTECGHGPETDSDCVGPEDPCYGLDCKETSSPFHPCYNANCECFKCGNVTTCEPLLNKWIAWCGSNADKSTACAYGECATENDTNGPNYRWKNQTTGGGSCSYTSGLVSVYECGTTGAPPHVLSCKTSSCTPTGDWTTYSGARKKCSS